MTSRNTLDYHTRISRHAVRESTGDSKRRVGLVSIPIYRAPVVRSIAPQFWPYYYQPVRLLVSASPNQSANSVFLSQ